MSQPEILHRPSPRVTDRYTNLSDLLDIAVGRDVGLTLYRTALGWQSITVITRSSGPIALTGTATNTGGALGSWNPPTTPIIITSSVLYVQNPSAGVANVNIGVAANTTTSSNTLGATLNTSTANTVAANLAPAAPVLLAAGNCVTASSTFNTTGFTGTLYLEYIQP